MQEENEQSKWIKGRKERETQGKRVTEVDIKMSPTLFIMSFVVASLLSFVLHVALNSPIFPLLSLPTTTFTSNGRLKEVEKLGKEELIGPEDVLMGPEGALYTATRDGWIMRMQPNGSNLEKWKFVGGHTLTGIAGSMDGCILVCDADKGLLKVGEEGVTVLASHVNDGSLIRLADEVIEASDGSVYFTDASSKYGFHDLNLDFLEARPHGRLLKYDPSINQTSVVLSDLGFANGVALSPDQDYLIVCETWRFRCLKYWLKGELKGESEIFIDNLPGGPDNILLAPDGSFWIALLQLRSFTTDLIYESPTAKRVIATFPRLLKMMKPAKNGAMVMKVAANGTILRTLDDSDGSVISFVTTAMEYEGHLYLGSLGNHFLGKIAL